MSEQVKVIEARAEPEFALVIPRDGDQPINVYLASLSPGSRIGQLTAICTALAVMQYDKPLGDLEPEERRTIRVEGIWRFRWWDLRNQHVAALRARLQALYHYSTANKTLAVVRSLLKTCWRLELVDHETMARATDVRSVAGSDSSTVPGRDVSYEEVVLLMRACADGTPQGVRDAALFAVGYHCAPRIAEVAALKLADLNPESGALLIQNGKGNKARTVYLSGGALQAMADWLAIRGDQPGPLFSRIRKDGLLLRGGLSTWSIAKRLERRRLQAGLEALTWHDWRRTLAGDLIDDGDLAGAQLVLGHSSPSITMRYSRRDLKIVESVLSKRRTPYIAPGKARTREVAT
jgi:integrase